MRDPNDANSKEYEYDLPEHVIILNDWLHTSIISKYTSFLHTYGDEEINSILINGRGVDVTSDEITKKPLLDYETPRSTFMVTQGKRYRFRIINSGVQYCPLHVSIDNHNLTLIALDGNPLTPIEVGSFYIIPGERVDFVIFANQQIDNYWIRVKGIFYFFFFYLIALPLTIFYKFILKIKGNADCSGTSMYQTAILKYRDSSSGLPKLEVNYENADPINPNNLIFNPFNQNIDETNKNQFLTVGDVRSSKIDSLSSSLSNKLSGKVDKKFYLSLDMNLVKNSAVYDNETWSDLKNDEKPWTSPQINNITFHIPPVPLIYQKQRLTDSIFCNYSSRFQDSCSKNDSEFCRCVHTLNINLNDVVEVIVVDGGSQSENHPIHVYIKAIYLYSLFFFYIYFFCH